MVVNQFIRRFGGNLLNGSVNIRKINNRYYAVSENLAQLIKNTDSLRGAGIFLGEKKREFVPSFQLLDIVGKSSKRKVVVNKKSGWLFLCGRDIFGRGVVRSNVRRGECLVVNGFDEILGWGVVMNDTSKKDEIVVKNKIDRGMFLRRER